MRLAFTRAGSPAACASVRPVTQASSSDHILVQRIADGDQLAMRSLFARHRVAVYRFVLRMVADAALAEDILSDVFFDVWRQASRFEGRCAVSTWLLSIARFKAFSALRRRRDAELDCDVAAAIPDPADDPEVAMQKKSTDELLRRSLARLPPEQGAVIDLVYYHGKTVAEVADIVGANEATVKTRMFYARRKLAELVKAA
jgi:RNA polymerase sigma-70 factor (ECF subfamily)